MSRKAIWLLVAFLTFIAACAPKASTPASADEQALLQIERDWAAALLKQDAPALDNILADDFFKSKQGQLTPKAKMLADLRAGVYKLDSVELSDMRAIVFGDQATVNGVAVVKGKMNGQDFVDKSRWTDIFDKRDGRWRAVVSYNVPIE
jgi:ketosteroid isomerase-like protein